MRISDWSSDVCSSDLADPDSLVDAAHDNLDPFAIWKTVMQNEKPGGHGERSVAVGTLDMAVWDAVAKLAGVPLWRLLADRYRGGVADDKELGRASCRERASQIVYISVGPLYSKKKK